MFSQPCQKVCRCTCSLHIYSYSKVHPVLTNHVPDGSNTQSYSKWSVNSQENCCIADFHDHQGNNSSILSTLSSIR